MAWIEKPNPGWAAEKPMESPSNCGNWPCTAPENVVLAFKETTYESNSELDEDANFQITSDNSAVAGVMTGCTSMPEWNSYRCTNEGEDLSLLIFESLDDDNEDRDVQPVYVIDENGNENKLNSFMDHGWEGFYSSMKHLQRFPAMVQAGTDYTIKMTGTPPKDMRFALRAGASEKGIKVLIPYTTTSAFSVRADG